MAWSEPDHVFRLCRRSTELKEDEQKDTLDGWLVKYFKDFKLINSRKMYHIEIRGSAVKEELL